MSIPGAHGGQKMALDPLALGLWMPVIHHESWKLNTGPLEESQCAQLLSHLSGPHSLLFFFQWQEKNVQV